MYTNTRRYLATVLCCVAFSLHVFELHRFDQFRFGMRSGNTDECDEGRGFEMVGGRCLEIPTDPKIWCHAVERCNKLNATLMHVDVFQKLEDLKKIMKRDNIGECVCFCLCL